MAASRLDMIDIVELGLFAPALATCWIAMRRQRASRDCALDLLSALFGVAVVPATMAFGAAYPHNDHGGSLHILSFLPMLNLAILSGGAIHIITRVKESVWSGAPFFTEVHFNLLLALFFVRVTGAFMTFENDMTTRWTGYCWLKICPSIFTAFYVAFSTIMVRKSLSLGHLEQEDRRIIYAIGISLPLLAVVEACKLFLLFWEGLRRFAPYRVRASNSIITILPQMLIIVAYSFVGLAAAPAAPQSIAKENETGSRAIGARVPAAHESLAEADAKSMKRNRNEHQRA